MVYYIEFLIRIRMFMNVAAVDRHEHVSGLDLRARLRRQLGARGRVALEACHCDGRLAVAVGGRAGGRGRQGR